ncbi:MAG: hypothetical protein ACR2Q4_21890 [Geminicoccaceae bacterium]
MSRSKTLGIGLLSCIAALSLAEPVAAFCVRNDTGGPIIIQALDDSAAFSRELANNKKACCSPKDEGCAIDKSGVKLSISSPGDKEACSITVSPKGNVNVTGRSGELTCKANKAGSTMDWASG